jgi:hypothetical protein
MSNIRYAVVPAGGTDVTTISVDGAVYVPMRPFCEALGLDWSNERKRIVKDPVLTAAVVKFTTAFAAGQEQTCLPLTHFHGWLFKLNLNTVNERARPIVEALQVEGYQVLHDYWVHGESRNPRAIAQLEQSERTARRRELPGLMDRLERERNAEKRRVVHALIVKACVAEDIEPPAIEKIGHEAPAVPDIVEPFWVALGELRGRGVAFDHSRGGDTLAISLAEIVAHFRDAGIKIRVDRTLRSALRLSDRPRYIGDKTVNSAITSRSKACMVFVSEASATALVPV